MDNFDKMFNDIFNSLPLLFQLLTVFGILVVICVVIIVAVMVCQRFSEVIYDLKYKYKYKHRFDKKPIAKCYCYDCQYYDRETYNCRLSQSKEGYCFADTHFCSEAYPRRGEDE